MSHHVSQHAHFHVVFYGHTIVQMVNVLIAETGHLACEIFGHAQATRTRSWFTNTRTPLDVLKSSGARSITKPSVPKGIKAVSEEDAHACGMRQE